MEIRVSLFCQPVGILSSDMVGYHSWRRLGDVASSLYALGYHEQVDTQHQEPYFLADLRAIAFARAYSADKNLSIFLGRPPRITRQYCQSQLPSSEAVNDTSFLRRRIYWSPEQPFTYTLETCWSFVCAVLKEEALDVFKEKDRDVKIQKTKSVDQSGEDLPLLTLLVQLKPMPRLSGCDCLLVFV